MEAYLFGLAERKANPTAKEGPALPVRVRVEDLLSNRFDRPTEEDEVRPEESIEENRPEVTVEPKIIEARPRTKQSHRRLVASPRSTPADTPTPASPVRRPHTVASGRTRPHTVASGASGRPAVQISGAPRNAGGPSEGRGQQVRQKRPQTTTTTAHRPKGGQSHVAEMRNNECIVCDEISSGRCSFCLRPKHTDVHRLHLEDLALRTFLQRPQITAVEMVKHISQYARSDEYALSENNSLMWESKAKLCDLHGLEHESIKEERAAYRTYISDLHSAWQHERHSNKTLQTQLEHLHGVLRAEASDTDARKSMARENLEYRIQLTKLEDIRDHLEVKNLEMEDGLASSKKDVSKLKSSLARINAVHDQEVSMLRDHLKTAVDGLETMMFQLRQLAGPNSDAERQGRDKLAQLQKELVKYEAQQGARSNGDCTIRRSQISRGYCSLQIFSWALRSLQGFGYHGESRGAARRYAQRNA